MSSESALQQATREYLAWAGDPLATLDAARAQDPEFALAHVFAGVLKLLGGERGASPAVQADLTAASGLEKRLSHTEKRHLAAFKAWASDEIIPATLIWEEILADNPRDAWALRFAHDTYFYLGQSAQIRDSIARVLPAWSENDPLHGFLLGMHAFGLEETGDYRSAERSGRRAVELNPSDTWAIHAVAHVLEMEGRTIEGIGWLSDLKAHWLPASGLAVHQWWHLALYLIERNRIEEVLAIYDDGIRGGKSGALLDLVDAAALLWRLQLIGINVGDRWDELTAQWFDHVDDHVLVFNDLHIGFVAVGKGDTATLARLQDSLGRHVVANRGTNRDISATVGEDVLRAIAAFGAGDYGRAVDLLLPIRYDLWRVGGSHAQRDVFTQTLIVAALRAGRGGLARALTAERVELKPHSRWAGHFRSEALALA